MRKIKTSDVFRFVRIINASGMKDELKAIYDDSQNSGKSAESVGYDAIFRIMGAVTTEAIEKKLYEFYGDIVGKTAKEVSDESIVDLREELKQVAEENDLKSFFDSVVKLIQ